MLQRRKHVRSVVNRVAKYQADPNTLPRDCLIIDISESGARLFSEAAQIPDSFSLLISGEQLCRQECVVAWRLGSEFGVKFVTKEREMERMNAIQEFRSRSLNALGKR